MDTVTEALQGIRLHSVVQCPTELSGKWGLLIESEVGAPYYIILNGHGWLEIEGMAPTELRSGDLVILPHNPRHTLRDAPDSPATSLDALLASRQVDSDGIWRWGSGGPTTVAIGGYFCFEEGQTSPLIQALPPILRIRTEKGRSADWLEPTLQFFVREASLNSPGASAIVTRLADILFIQAIRTYMESLPEGERNWLGAMTDPQIGGVLARLHANPEATWRVESMAREAAMSRSAFAARFNDLVGEPPMQYLTRWRVHRAALLLRSQHTVLDAANRVGYQSEAAFSRVFKQWTGKAPGSYRRMGRS